jgi:histidinol dehydrogenase
VTAATPALRLRRLDLATPGDGDALTGLCRRGALPDRAVRDAVREILDAIRRDPSTAVRDAGRRFGGGGAPADGRLVLGPLDLQQAAGRLAPRTRAALDQAIEHVTRFAASQRPQTTTTRIAEGIDIERRWEPLDSVGAYVPGGSAAYPSSLVMTVVPARVGGVRRILVATPAGADGQPNDVVLGAAGVLGVDQVVVAGGAQAIGALADHGAIVLAPDLDGAVDFVNRYAPEHLSVDVDPLEPTVARLRHAGSLFVGPWAPESAGDYATGANHVLPTGGLARSSGPLAVETFGHFVQVQRVSREGLAGIRETIGALATAEGLLAHRDAVEARFE